MSQDLIRRTDITTSETKSERTTKQKEPTEVARAQQALAERLMFGAPPRPQDTGPLRIALCVDGTSSMGEFVEPRALTREAAAAIANRLYAEAPGAAVLVKYFRGDDRNPKRPRQLRTSKKWYTTPEELTRALTAIEPWPGWTQHCALLRDVVAEAEKQAIHQVILVSDAFERRTPRRPDGDDLAAAKVHAARLRDLGVKLVIGYKGTIRGACPLDRAGVNAEKAFRDLVQANGGHLFLCDPRDLAQLGARFAEIGTQARLRAEGDTAGAQRLLEHLQPVPFEFEVGTQVPSARCTSESEE